MRRFASPDTGYVSFAQASAARETIRDTGDLLSSLITQRRQKPPRTAAGTLVGPGRCRDVRARNPKARIQGRQP
jgi:hypothetical protein